MAAVGIEGLSPTPRRVGRLAQHAGYSMLARTGDVLRPACNLLLGPGGPADDRLGLLPHELEDEGVDVESVREGTAGQRELGRERGVIFPCLLGFLPDRSERRKQLLLRALLGEENLDGPLELDEGRVAWLGEPALERTPALVGDLIDGARRRVPDALSDRCPGALPR